MKPTDHTERDDSPTVQNSERSGTAAGPTSRQLGPQNDPSMRDGNSSHGNPYETEPDVASTDTDVGDMSDVLDDEPPDGVGDGDPMEDVVDDEPDPADVAEAAEDEELPAEELIAADERDMHDLERAGPSAAERAAHERTDASAERVMGGRPVTDRGPPLPDYPDLTVPQVIDRLGDLSDDQVRAVREYERTHRNRKTLLDRLDRHLSGTGRRQTARSG
ncbi:MAG: hypothetical protein U0871_29535 [Gemmataceae bacterium]